MRLINDHLVFPYREGFPLHLLPEARVGEHNGVDWVAVPHSVDAAQFLSNLGMSPPSPIRTHYRWPGRFTPFKHQIATAEFLTLNKRAFVVSGMGTGKTCATGWAADYLMQERKVKRCLVIAPLSTLQRVWGDMFFLDFPHRSFAVLHGSRAKRRQLLAEEHDFYVVNPEGVGSILDLLQKRKDIDLFIIDEIAEYRNANTIKWKQLASAISPERAVWGLTGAPCPQAPSDAYAQVRLLRPENVANLSFTRFKQQTMRQVTTFKWVARDNAMERVYALMQPCIRFKKEDCLDLPPTTYQDRECELTPEQHKHYKALAEESLTNISSTQVTAINAGVLLQKLVQVACGVVYGADGEQAVVDAGPRIEIVKELVEEAEGKVIVFVPFTGTLDHLAEKLRKHYTVETVDGRVSATKRNRIFQDFQNSDTPRILVAHPKTMAHGLSLTAANVVVWYAPYASHAIYEQACERVARPGQTRKTSIVHIAGTAVERKIYAALRERKAMQDVLLDLIERGTM